MERLKKYFVIFPITLSKTNILAITGINYKKKAKARGGIKFNPNFNNKITEIKTKHKIQGN